MYALTRALQLELGITSTTDTFGPTTMSTLTSKYGTIGVGFTGNKNVVTIIQCALWCKGYSGGPIIAFGGTNPGKNIGAFTTDVGAAVAAIRGDMGLSATASMPPKVFKSLLNMDAYITVTGGSDRFRQIQRYLNGRYWERSDYRIMPCDGNYSRDVQQGVMYALQYGLGMADGVANGNFGPGTQSGLRSQGSLSVGSTDDNRGFVTLFQSVLCFNGFDADVNGKYSSATATAAKAFQAFAELPKHGTADFATWASLLVSTGDPDRSVTACDTDTPLSAAQASFLRSSGYGTVGRYLNGSSKGIQAGELDRAFVAGLSVFPIYQEWNSLDELREYGAETFGYRQGRAAALRARQLGFAAGTTIYFPIDADATADEIEALVIPYYRGVNRGIALSSTVTYTVGCYGPRNVGTQVAAKGLASTSFVAGLSTGWSANLGFALPKNWAYDQIKETNIGSGATAINIDRNAASTRAKPATRSTVLPIPTTGGELRQNAVLAVRGILLPS
jgi:peptidoglycan hydrolase-like protein with peptidoglycan-binding domain